MFVTNSVDRRAKSEYSFGKLLNSARVLSVKRFGMEENVAEKLTKGVAKWNTLN